MTLPWPGSLSSLPSAPGVGRGAGLLPPAQSLGLLEDIKLFPGGAAPWRRLRSSVGGSPCLCLPLGSCGALGGAFSRGSGAVQCAALCFPIGLFPETSDAERLFPRVFDIGVCSWGGNVPSSPFPLF